MVSTVISQRDGRIFMSQSFCVGFTCSVRASVGFLQALFSPTQQNMHVQITDDCLTLGVVSGGTFPLTQLQIDNLKVKDSGFGQLWQ